MSKWVVLTNNLRGIYFGEMREEPDVNGTVTLYNMRHCFSYICGEHKGTWGLVLSGPRAGSKIGPTIPYLTIRSVANYAECSEDAVKAWRDATW
jgi:hypothetical protein